MMTLGYREDMTKVYTNLGNLYQIHEELKQAEAIYQKALAPFQEIRAKPQIKHVQGLLEALR